MSANDRDMGSMSWLLQINYFFFFFSSRRRHTRSKRDWSSDVCSSDLGDGSSAHLTKRTRGPWWCWARSEEHTSELQSRFDLVCRLLLEKKKGFPKVSTVKGELVPTTSTRLYSVLPSVSSFNSTGRRKRLRSCEISPTTRNPLLLPSR